MLLRAISDSLGSAERSVIMHVLWTTDSSSYNFEIITELLTEAAGAQVGVYILRM
jgi:hypothetical protein